MKEAADNPHKREVLTVNAVMGKYIIDEAKHRASLPSILPRLRRFNEFFGQHTKWNHINDAMVSNYVSQRRGEYVGVIKNYKNKTKNITQSDRKISARTINKELMTLGRINRLASEKWNVEPASFSVKKHILETPDSERPYFSPEQEKAIYDNLPSHWQQAFRFAMLTGVRASNIFANRQKSRQDRSVKRKDILLEDQIIRFYGKSAKPGGKVIEIPIVEELYRMLFNDMDVAAKKPDDHIFVYPKDHHRAGQPLKDYRKALYGAMEKAGFQRKRGEGIHLTRHTVLTKVAKESGLTTAQKLAGHADSRTTEAYAHRQVDQLRTAMESALTDKNKMAEKRQNEESKGFSSND